MGVCYIDIFCNRETRFTVFTKLYLSVLVYLNLSLRAANECGGKKGKRVIEKNGYLSEVTPRKLLFSIHFDPNGSQYVALIAWLDNISKKKRYIRQHFQLIHGTTCLAICSIDLLLTIDTA